MAYKTILDLNYDVLLLVMQNLSSSSTVCLALTSHFFHDFICSATNKKLKDITSPPLLRSLFLLRHHFEYARLMRQLVTFIPYSRIKAHLRHKRDDKRVGCWCPTYNGPRCWRVDCIFERGWEMNLKEDYEYELLAVERRGNAQLHG